MLNDTIFDQSRFQHIDLVEVPGGIKKLPLCNLMNNGRCMNRILLLTTKDGKLEWESIPGISSCTTCEFHITNCERC